MSRNPSLVAVMVGALAMALFVATGARTHPPDAVAYADLLVQGSVLHPQHLIHNLLGDGVLRLALMLHPQAVPLAVLSALNGVIGGLGIGVATRLMMRAGAPLGLSAAAGLGLAASYGWWSLATTWEVHVAPVTAVLLALWWLGEGRWLRGAGALALGILLHKTMVLALPAVLLAWALQRRSMAQMVQLGAVVGVLVGLAYSAAFAVEVQRQPHSPTQIARTLILGEVQHAVPGAPGHLGRADASLHGAAGALALHSAPRCGFETPGLPLDLVTEGDRATARTAALFGLATIALGALLALLVRRREHRLLPISALGWATVALPAIAWFEPANFEYYLGPLTALWLAAVSGLAWGMARAPRALQPLAILGVGLGAVALLAHNGGQDILPAATSGTSHQVCPNRASPTQDRRPPRGRRR